MTLDAVGDMRPAFEPGTSTLDDPATYFVCIVCFRERHETVAQLGACLTAAARGGLVP